MDYGSFKSYVQYQIGDEKYVYRIDSTHASQVVPPHSYKRIQVGDCVSCYVYHISKDYIHMHINDIYNGIIPIQRFRPFYRENRINTPPIGSFYQCIVNEINENVLTLETSSVKSFRKTYINCEMNTFYIATVVDVTDDKMIYIHIETLGIMVHVPKILFSGRSKYKIEEIEEGKLIMVECCGNFEFRIVSLDSVCFICENDDPVSISEEREDSVKNIKYKNASDHEISCLKPIVVRPYPSINRVNYQNINLLTNYLRRHKTLVNVSKISQITRISNKTIKRWHEKIWSNPDWSPLVSKKYPTKRCMDELLESSIMNYIQTKFLSKGYQVNDRMARAIAIMFWDQHPDHRLSCTFKCSYRWLARFKKKYNLVNRRVHYHRRPKMTKELLEASENYYRKIADLYRKHEEAGTLDFLINIDETCWKIANFGEFTWSIKGADHVEFSNTYNEKENFTAVAAITANNMKFPLCVIKKGQTERSLNVFSKLSNYIQIEVSQNGWNTVTSFARYLIWLRSEINLRYKGHPKFSPDAEIDLVLDLFSSHRHDLIKKLAEELNFNLIYIPAGFTDLFQPLDRYVFGALKSIARAEYYNDYIVNPEIPPNIERACEILIECWSRISKETINKAWNIYANNSIDFDSIINSKTFKWELETPPLKIKEKIERDRFESCKNPKISQDLLVDDDDEENILDELYHELKNYPHIIPIINEIIEYEDSCIIKPILNHYGMSYVNVLVQILNTIPYMMDYFKEVETDDTTISTIKNCLDFYYSSHDTVKDFPDEYMCCAMNQDISENIMHFLKSFPVEYGLKTDREHLPVIRINGNVNEALITNALDDIINEDNFSIDNLLFIEKLVPNHSVFPESFRYNRYLFILKSVVAAVKSRNHLYCFIRRKFTNDFIMINDAKIHEIEYSDVLEEETFLSMYYVFNVETHNMRIDRKHEIVEQYETELPINDRIYTILNELGYEYDYKKDESEYLRNAKNLVKVTKTYKDITPLCVMRCIAEYMTGNNEYYREKVEVRKSKPEVLN